MSGIIIGVIVTKYDNLTYMVDTQPHRIKDYKNVDFVGSNFVPCLILSPFSSTDKGTGFIPTYKIGDRVVVLTSENGNFIIGSIPKSNIAMEDELMIINNEGAKVHVGDRAESDGSVSTANVTVAGKRLGMISGTNYQYSHMGDERTATEIPTLPDDGIILIRKDGEDLAKIHIMSGTITIETTKDLSITTTGNMLMNTDENGRSVAADGDTVDVQSGTYNITNGVINITNGALSLSPATGTPITVTPSVLEFQSITNFIGGTITISNGTLNSPERKEKVESV